MMGVSSPPAAAKAALSKSAAVMSCLAALPSFAGDASLELAPDDDVIEFILVSIAEANLKRVKRGRCLMDGAFMGCHTCCKAYSEAYISGAESA